jgi:hypothetical protein
MRSLPQPGDSLERHLQLEVVRLTLWAILPTLIGVLTLVEWFRAWFPTPPTPRFITVLFLLITPLAIYKCRRIWRAMDQIVLGLHGERTVGQLLESLRAQGYRVFHDITEEGYNIDHMLIGPAGVFAIETKTHSKPLKGQVNVIYDGERITLNGHAPDRDPLIQAKAAARHVRNILKQTTGKDTRVEPVVLYPGWFVQTTIKNPHVWVDNEKRFLGAMERKPTDGPLSRSDIAALSAAMDQYLRRR